MADDARTCANCGNVQAAGDFCEKCGTRMPAAATAAPSAPAAAAGNAAAYAAAQPSAPSSTPPPASPPPTSPPPYGAQGQYGGPPQYGGQGQYGAGAPPYGYAQDRGGWGKLFDFSFQGFVTAATIKTLYIINLALIGLWILFEIIYVAMTGDKYSVIRFFISIFVAVFWFFLSRVIFELMATAMRIRDK